MKRVLLRFLFRNVVGLTVGAIVVVILLVSPKSPLNYDVIAEAANQEEVSNGAAIEGVADDLHSSEESGHIPQTDMCVY